MTSTAFGTLTRFALPDCLNLARRTVDVRDVQIAGIAAARRATLATRNIRHFEHLGVSLVNPRSA